MAIVTIAPTPQEIQPVLLTIPLDTPIEPEREQKSTTTTTAATDGSCQVTEVEHESAVKRKPIFRRDSLKRREALLKGKEGSRRRQRWENDNFVANPYFTPPTASDFLPCPLHTPRTVRYEFAQFYNPAVHSTPHTNVTDTDRVPRTLKVRIKKSKGAISLLKELEEEVRRYAATVFGMEYDYELEHHDEREEEKTMVEMVEKDSEDEDIVFVPRGVKVEINGKSEMAMDKEKAKKEDRNGAAVKPDARKMVYQADIKDQSASFVRWIIHTIAPYYGLRSWSENNGSSRIAYVGMISHSHGHGKGKGSSKNNQSSPKCTTKLPRPLWGMLH